MPDDLIKRMEIGRGVKPVIENPKLPLMTERTVRPRLIGGKTVLMVDDPKPDAGKQGRMAAVPKGTVRVPQPTSKKPLPDMRAPKAVAPTLRDGYVRLRLRVSGDRVEVVGAKAVAGPLVERQQLHGSLAYDVTLGAKRVAAGAILDLGERRSFPNESPKAPPEQRGHYISEVPTYEINVRVPASELPIAALPKLTIRLYRIKEDVDIGHAPPGPLGERFTRELREVGRVNGVRVEDLSAPHRAELRKALG
jgi:hypothetical protein